MPDDLRIVIPAATLRTYQKAVQDLDPRLTRLEQVVNSLQARVNMAVLQLDNLPQTWHDELALIHEALHDLHHTIKGTNGGGK
jgi:hypothetical protein